MRFVVAVAVFQNNVYFRIQNQHGIKVSKRILIPKGSRVRIVFVARGHDKRYSTSVLLPLMVKPTDLGWKAGRIIDFLAIARSKITKNQKSGRRRWIWDQQMKLVGLHVENPWLYNPVVLNLNIYNFSASIS